MQHRVGKFLIAYGIFLLVGGFVGYAIAEETSTAALFNGAFFGVVMSVMGILLTYDRQWAFPASLSATGLFSLTFFWRMTVRIIEFDLHTSNNMYVVLLLALMGIVSTALFILMIKHYRH
ncbi:MAG: TMEM14 family protein [Ignavibacteria bacterium]|nr:TMEM14 family protein [Ignavibacteria bacterium]